MSRTSSETVVIEADLIATTSDEIQKGSLCSNAGQDEFSLLMSILTFSGHVNLGVNDADNCVIPNEVHLSELHDEWLRLSSSFTLTSAQRMHNPLMVAFQSVDCLLSKSSISHVRAMRARVTPASVGNNFAQLSGSRNLIAELSVRNSVDGHLTVKATQKSDLTELETAVTIAVTRWQVAGTVFGAVNRHSLTSLVVPTTGPFVDCLGFGYLAAVLVDAARNVKNPVEFQFEIS